ncbi:MAG: MFS transporter [Deltaproteobacteria bacterium]|nr:MFS transporter [Deltaproteobacteria bacterium]MBK8234565.1 MFS transporter [Deltaproteobacteria bacterium]MBK8715307.1 MFS transporter [Deltaproteobacteria bacterium]MBP7284990.1 MFS transporter [Nannocystaceae bacterium]
MATPRLATPAFVLGFAANFAHSLAFHSYVHLPGHLQALGASELDIGVIVATMAIAAIGARPFIGALMDERGRRGVARVGSIVNVLTCAAYLGIHSIGPALFALRVLHGIAEAMLFSVLFTIAADVVPAARRTEGIALFGISGMIPLSLAGWLGDALLEVADYDALFFATLVAAGVGTVACFALPDSRPPRHPSDAPARPFLRAVFAAPLRPLWLVGFGFALAVASYFAFLKTFVGARGVGSVGAFFGAYTVAAIVLRLGFGRLPDRFGARPTLLPALACTAIAVALLAEADSNLDVVLAGVFGGIGHGYAFPILSAMVVDRALPAERGAALSTFTALFDLGLVVGGPLFGLVLELSDYRVMYWLAGALTVAAMIGFVLWDRPSASGRDQPGARLPG